MPLPVEFPFQLGWYYVSALIFVVQKIEFPLRLRRKILILRIELYRVLVYEFDVLYLLLFVLFRRE
jgi:hypothetical protein